MATEVKENFYEEVYEILFQSIDPLATKGLLPTSVVESFDFLLDFYLTSLKEVEDESTT